MLSCPQEELVCHTRMAAVTAASSAETTPTKNFHAQRLIMLTARMLPRPLHRAVLLLGAALVVAALAAVWYLASPLVLTQAVSEGQPAQEARTSVTTGHFGAVDAIHQGEGTASVLRLANDQRVLRLEDDFRVTNGPDLYVYLSGAESPRSSDELHASGAVEIARLKGNVGGQNYDLPADLELAQFRSVVIYCRRFTTVFSTARLAP
jgi:Electron transfer DM13